MKRRKVLTCRKLIDDSFGYCKKFRKFKKISIYHYDMQLIEKRKKRVVKKKDFLNKNDKN